MGQPTIRNERDTMPDIALRFNKDMLVLSTPIDYQLKSQGFTNPGDREYVALCESDLIEEVYKVEKLMDTPCLVTATEGITRARLAYSRFEKQAEDMARIAYEVGSSFTPQHLIAAVGPTGLPLDTSISSSVKQSIQQYRDATEVLMRYPFDALYFSNFSSLADAECALRGAREVFEGPLMISLAVSDESDFSTDETFALGVEKCDELGADVIGTVSAAKPERLVYLSSLMRKATHKPLLCEVHINKKDSRQFEPTDENPYPTPDELFNAACALQKVGVQFLRAVGAATPAYTGALNAAVHGMDVEAIN